MNSATQRMCTWAGLPMLALWMAGFWFFGGFVPPPAPTMTAAEIAQRYAGELTEVRIGLLLTMLGAALLAPYCAVISAQMKRIEGERSPLAYAQLALGTALLLEFLFPCLFLLGALFRDRPAESVQMLNDIFWVAFVGAVSTAVVQLVLIGIVIMRDERAVPVFPRWSGYLNVWIGLLFAGGGLCAFFKTGPFAWDGVFAFWIPLSVFGLWLAVMTVLLLRAISSEEVEVRAGGQDVGERVERLAAELAALRAELTAGRENREVTGLESAR